MIDNKKIVSLPLNARDVFGALGSLTPGIQPTRSGLTLGGGVQFNVKGLRQSDNNGMLDGTQISETNGSLQFFVNPDAVAEFEIKSGLYGAEYGIKPGGQFSAVTKSGTNDLHGTLFYFHRNDNLDARSFFQSEKTEFKRHQYGAVAGAPIMIPGLFDGRDKAWWFVAWQSERVKEFATLTGNVPTADQRAGLFAETIMDPLTGQLFPNNTVPSGRFDPVYNKLVGFYPNPNTDLSRGFNYNSPNAGADRSTDEIIVKMDFKTGEDSHWSGRFLWSDRPITFANAIDEFRAKNKLVNWAQNITNTRNFGSNIVNEAGFHFFRRPYVPGEPPDHLGFGPTLGIPDWPIRGVDVDGVPVTNVSGFLRIGSRGNFGPVPEGQWEVKDNVSWTKGSHFFKAGYHYRYHYVFFGLENRSNFNFDPDRYTGNAFANFQQGYLTSSRAGSEARLNHRFPGHYFYFQDSWKATPKLTVQLGLRYELRRGWQDQRGFSTNLEPTCVEQNADNPIPTCFSPALAIADPVFPATGRFAAGENIFDWTKNG